MPIYQKSTITDFFKPFSQPPQPKRPHPDEDSLQSQPRKSRSVTPKGFPGSLPIRSCDNTPSKPIATPTSPDSHLNASKERAPDQVANAITSTLIPFPSSQGPVITSSQRVVKKGGLIVTNSDDEGSDTDASLGDIDELLRLRRQPPQQISSPLTEPDSTILTPSLPSSPKSKPGLDLEPEATTARRTRGSKPVRKYSDLNSLPPAPKYKFDLDFLVKRSEKDEISAEGITKAKKLLATLDQDGCSATAKRDVSVMRNPVDPGLVASVMKEQGDENDAKRLMLAIERTEALQQDSSWSFFEEETENTDVEQPASLDAGIGSLDGVLSEPAFRQQAFLGGFVDVVAINETLPDEMLVWLIDAACCEARDDLRYSYALVLKNAAKNLTSIIDSRRVDTLFRKLGASNDALDSTVPIVPIARAKSKEEKVHRCPRLESMMKLLSDLAPQLNTASRNDVIRVLCRLLVDHTINQNSHTVLAIEEALEGLIDAIPEESFDKDIQIILETTFGSLGNVSLQAQLIQNLPAFSPRLNIFRRRLSLAFFFEDRTYLSKPSRDLVNLGSISRRLTAPRFAVNKATEYTELTATISILNVGLDCGDPPLAGIDKNAETAFNQQVDELSYRVKSISTQIIDTGASQLKRTEAKEMLEGLYFRLMYAVRTEPKPKNNRLGHSNGDRSWKIKGFLEKRQAEKEQLADTDVKEILTLAT